jgi:hypothetical protein
MKSLFRSHVFLWRHIGLSGVYIDLKRGKAGRRDFLLPISVNRRRVVHVWPIYPPKSPLPFNLSLISLLFLIYSCHNHDRCYQQASRTTLRVYYFQEVATRAPRTNCLGLGSPKNPELIDLNLRVDYTTCIVAVA